MDNIFLMGWMYIMKKFSLLMILSVLILLITTTGCRKQDFSGSITSDETQFLMNYSISMV